VNYEEKYNELREENIALQKKLVLSQNMCERTVRELSDLKQEVSKYKSDMEEKFEALTLGGRSIRQHIEDLDTANQREKNHTKKYLAEKLSELSYKVDLEMKGAKSHITDLGKHLNICEEENIKMHEERLLAVPQDMRSRSSDIQSRAPLQQDSRERKVRPAANCASPSPQCVSIWLIS
jgi:predicted RNase H-like nuclease (RuvC/YqgF family)